MSEAAHDLLSEQLDRLLGDEVDPHLPRALDRGESPAALRAKVDALDLALALVPESAGGAGLNASALGGVFQTLGYHAAPLGLGESLFANALIARSGLDARPNDAALALGALTIDPRTREVSGACVAPWAESARRVVAAAPTPAGATICVLSADDAAPTPVAGIAREPRTRFTFAGAKPLASFDAPDDWVLLDMAALRSAQIAGALSRALALSLAYANTRVQFGRPIGKFQAVQHMIAELAAEAAAAKAGAELALRARDAGADFAAVAAAKIRASLAAGKGAALAHQIHGAIGVTEEHALHDFTRRLWQWRDDAGDEFHWSERLGRLMIQGGGAALWRNIVAIGEACDGAKRR